MTKKLKRFRVYYKVGGGTSSLMYSGYTKKEARNHFKEKGYKVTKVKGDWEL